MSGSRRVEPGRKKYKNIKRRPKPTSDNDLKGTIMKYMTKTVNTQGMGSKEPNVGSKRKSVMVEDDMVRVDENCGSYGAQEKKLRLGKIDHRCQGDAKSKTGKSRKYAKKTVIGGGGGANYPDIRRFWNSEGKGSPRGVGGGSRLVTKTLDTMSVVF